LRVDSIVCSDLGSASIQPPSRTSYFYRYIYLICPIYLGPDSILTIKLSEGFDVPFNFTKGGRIHHIFHENYRQKRPIRCTIEGMVGVQVTTDIGDYNMEDLTPREVAIVEKLEGDCVVFLLVLVHYLLPG